MSRGRGPQAHPTGDDRADTREALLASAAQIVGELGPEGLKIPYVADRAGVDRPTAYEHFATRDELISAVNERVGRELTEMMMMEVHPDLSGLLDYVVDYAVHHPELARLWMYELVSGNRRSNEHSLAMSAEFVKARVGGQEVQEGVDGEALTHIAVAGMLAWSLYANAELREGEAPKEYAVRFARELKRLLLYGALRPEQWPEMVASLGEPNPAGKQSQRG